MGAAPATAILIPLAALCLPGNDAPVASPQAAPTLDRLAILGRPVVLVGARLQGRRLPVARAARRRWLEGLLGPLRDVRLREFTPPSVGMRDEAAVMVAAAAWAALRASEDAAWLITDQAADTRPAHRGGLAVVQVGPPGDDGPTWERPEIQARDLTDAVHLLLTADLFGRPPGAAGGTTRP